MQCPTCGYEFERNSSHNFCPVCGGALPPHRQEEDREIDLTLEPAESELRIQLGPSSAQGEQPGEPIPSESTLSEPSAPLTAAPEPARAGVPWEDDDERGLVRPFLRTVQMVMLHPAEFFRAMPLRDGYRDPLFFGVAVGWITVLIMVVLLALFFCLLPAGVGFLSDSYWTPAILVILAGVILALSPLILGVLLFIRAGIRHLFVLLVASGETEFETTFRVVAYAQPTLFVRLLLIPCCAGLAEKVWNWNVQAIGLQEAHGMTRGRALVAVLPSIVITVLPWQFALSAAAFLLARPLGVLGFV